jgi:SNF2 family DNA or RNA helicase
VAAASLTRRLPNPTRPPAARRHPRQNNLRELWALLHFLEPQLFPDCDAFAERYDLEDAEKVGVGARGAGRAGA